MSEAQKYQELQNAKYKLREALEEIKAADEALGGDGKTGTYEGEVEPIIDEIFPDCIN